MIRALVIDDSAFMRKALSMMLESDPEIRVVDTARNGAEGVQKVLQHRPDIVTMDVEMPVMDGITALRQIMKECPCPVLMISSLTQEGAHATVEALQAGAVDFIPKQSSASLEITRKQADLVEKVKTITRSKCRIFHRSSSPSLSATSLPGTPSGMAQGTSTPHRQQPLSFRDAGMIVIGVSTGGPFALQRVVPLLPADLPVPVAIVQHMPPHFTRSLADRLNQISPLRVVEAEHGMPLEAGSVYIAPGGQHLTFRSAGSSANISTSDGPSDSLHRPSVDVMFNSADALFRGKVLALVMTGMGKDGLQGARRIKEHGGVIVAQDESSCVVYGMPRAIAEAGLASAILPLDHIAEALTRAVAAPVRA